MTVEDVANYVDSNGLDYAIEHGLSAERIKDEGLRSAWNQARSALAEVQSILEQYSQ